MTSIDPDALLADLKCSATARKCRSLDVVHGVLEKQAKEGALDFSIATIGRLSAAAGGPTTQSIRNKGGSDYRRLIEAWAAAQRTTTRKPPAPTSRQNLPTRDNDILERIDDPALRAVVGTIIAERNRFRSEIQVLKAQSEFVVDRRATKPNTAPSVEMLPSLQGLLTAMEREALTDSISDNLLSQRGWSLQLNGRMKDENGRTLYKPGYASALQKILQAMGVNPGE